MDDITREQKRGSALSIIILGICSFLVGIVLASALSDLIHISNLQDESNNKIVGNCYVGYGDYLGLVFYFYDENTYRCTTSSENKIVYGTYELIGNSMTLNISSESYAAVVVDNGDKIMINNSKLCKITDSNQIAHYTTILSK